MRERIRKIARGRALLVSMALVAAWAVILSPGSPKCASTAYAAGPTEWCYTVPITVQYDGPSTVTNQAVRALFNASGLIGSGQMDQTVWDLYPYVGSFDQETDVTAGDLASSSAAWWFQIPSISSGETQIVTLLFGRANIQRDQGTVFTGNDSASAAHSSDFNITDGLSLTVELEMVEVGGGAVAQTSTLASHWSGNAGYELTLTRSASALGIRGKVATSTCDVAWNSSWTDTNRNISMTFNAPNIVIAVDGVTQNTCNTGYASISTTSTPFTVGNSLKDAIVRDVRLLSGSTVKAHWTFDPTDMAETVSTNPYQGTIVDASGNGHTATYTFNRSQGDWTVSIGSVTLVSASGAGPLSSTVTNLIGDRILGPLSIGGAGTPTTGDAFSTFVSPAVSGFTGPSQLAWATLFTGAAILLAIGTYRVFQYIPLAFFVAGIPFAFAVVRGYLPAWYLLIWALFVVMSWWAVRQGEGAG